MATPLTQQQLSASIAAYNAGGNAAAQAAAAAKAAPAPSGSGGSPAPAPVATSASAPVISTPGPAPAGGTPPAYDSKTGFLTDYGKSIGDKAVQPGDPAATAAITPAPTPTTPAAGSTPAPTFAYPTTELMPGSTGANVKALQDALVKGGFMSQPQVNTGYGTYGPQTSAAVAALQKSLGIDNSSGPGHFGPQTIAALAKAGAGTNPSGITTPTGPADASTPAPSPTDPYAHLDPVAKQVKMYTDAYAALGLGDIKSQYQSVIKEQKDLNSEMQDKIDGVNNDPWISEGLRTKQIEKIQNSYKVRLDTLTHLETLYDSMYKQGQAQVESIVSKADADIAATNSLAEKQSAAAAAIAKDNQVVSTGGRELLVNKVTGKVVADLGPSNKTASTGTAAERKQATVDQINTHLFVPGKTIGTSGVPYLDAEGIPTPQGWKTVLNASGMSRKEFIAEFGHSLVSVPKPGATAGTVSTAYGLTPNEVKSLGATLRT